MIRSLIMARKEMHIGRVGTRLQRVTAGLDEKMLQVEDMLGASANMLRGVEENLKVRSPSAAAKLAELRSNVRRVIQGINETMSLYSGEFYEEDAESAVQESLVTAKAVSKDMISYMAGCVLSEACYSLMSELKPETAEKTTADDISKFLSTEGVDFYHFSRMLEQEMKRIAYETDNAWQGRCSIDELCNEFPEANVPMKVALLSRGHDCKLEQDPAIASYMKARGVTSGAVPPCSDDSVLDACHALFEAMNENETAEAAELGEAHMNEEEAKHLARIAYDHGYTLRDINGADEMSPEAFILALKSLKEGQTPTLDIHVDGEGVLTFMEKKGDKYGFVYDDKMPELVTMLDSFLSLPSKAKSENEEVETEIEEE